MIALLCMLMAATGSLATDYGKLSGYVGEVAKRHSAYSGIFAHAYELFFQYSHISAPFVIKKLFAPDRWGYGIGHGDNEKRFSLSAKTMEKLYVFVQLLQKYV